MHVHNCGTDVVARIVMAWDPQVMTVSLLFSSPQIVVARVVGLECHKDFCVSIVYGHNCVVARRQLWHDMQLVGGAVGTDPWLQMGDFNVVRKANERLEGFDRAASTEFNDCLDSLEMDDMMAKGFWYTWTNKRGGLGANMSKLDRALVNPAWLNLFPDSEACFLAPGVSDHSPIMVSIVPEIRRKRPFKFFNFLDEACCFSGGLGYVLE